LEASVYIAGPKEAAQNTTGLFTHIGDAITAIDGHVVKDMDEITTYVELHKSVIVEP
jgi:PDZ domain-containing secreted protein